MKNDKLVKSNLSHLLNDDGSDTGSNSDTIAGRVSSRADTQNTVKNTTENTVSNPIPNTVSNIDRQDTAHRDTTHRVSNNSISDLDISNMDINSIPTMSHPIQRVNIPTYPYYPYMPIYIPPKEIYPPVEVILAPPLINKNKILKRKRSTNSNWSTQDDLKLLELILITLPKQDFQNYLSILNKRDGQSVRYRWNSILKRFKCELINGNLNGRYGKKDELENDDDE